MAYQSAADLYREILGREPENAQVLAEWQNYVGPSIEPHEVEAFKSAAAPELAAKANDIATSLYQYELGRQPENTQVRDAWANYVQQVGVSGAKNAFMQDAAPELSSRSTDVATQLYQQYLGRAPENQDVLNHWANYVQQVGVAGATSAFQQAAQSELAAKAGTQTGTQTGVLTQPLSPSQSTLSPNFADYVYRMLAKGEQAANMPYVPYEGQRFAGPSPLQLRAYSGIANLADPAAYAEAQRFLTMAGSGAANTFYNPTQFATGLGPPAGIASLPQTEPSASGTVAARGSLPTVEQELSRFGVTPGWVGQIPSTAIPTSQTLEGAFPEAAASFADGGNVMTTGLASVAPSPYQLGSVADYMNPYTSNVTDIAAREARRQADIGRTAEQARMAQAGAYGGSRQAIMEAERQRNLNTQIGDMATKGLQSAYDTALKQRMDEATLGLDAQKLSESSRQFGATFGLKGQELGLQAGQMLTNLGTQQGRYGLDALKAMMDAGQQQQGLAQQPLDFGYQQWQESQKFPYQQASYMSSLLEGMPLTATPYSSGGSDIAQLLSGIALGLGVTAPK